MRRYLFVLPFVIACGTAETPPPDSAAMAPAGLTDADVAGTWTGTATMEGTDSVLARWTQVCSAGTCRGTAEGSADTVVSTYTIEADSAHGVSQPFADPTMGGVRLIDHWIAKPTGSGMTGYGWFVLADRPDSVVVRYRMTGTKNP